MTIRTEIELVCDDCGFAFAGPQSARELRQEAKKHGWVWIDHREDLCADCKPQIFKLEDD